MPRVFLYSSFLSILLLCSPVQSAPLTNARLDALYQGFTADLAINNAHDLEFYRLPAAGDYLDPVLLTEELRTGVGHFRSRSVFDLLHRGYLASALITFYQLQFTDALALPDDFYDYLLTRYEDAAFRSQFGELSGRSGVSAETVDQLAMAGSRYFVMVKDDMLVRHHPGVSAAERLTLITSAEAQSVASRRLFRALAKTALGRIAGEPAVREDFTYFIHRDNQDQSSALWERIEREVGSMRNVGRALGKDFPADVASRYGACLDLEHGREIKRVDFAGALFQTALHCDAPGPLQQAAEEELYPGLAQTIEAYDECVLDLYEQVRGRPELVRRINSVLSFAESWVRSKKRLHYGDDLLFFEEVIEQASRYRSALSPYPRDDYFPVVTLDDAGAKIPVVLEAIAALMQTRQQLIAVKQANGSDASAAPLVDQGVRFTGGFFPGNGKEEVVQAGKLPEFDGWLSARVAPVPRLTFGQVAEAALNRLQLARLYLKDEEYEKAREQILAAVALAPDHWDGWQEFGRVAGLLNQRYESARAYRRSLALVEKCRNAATPACAAAPTTGAAYGELLFRTGYAQLQIADYRKAAEYFNRALPSVAEDLQEATVEWLAVAEFGANDLDTAWHGYRKSFTGTPLPEFYPEPQEGEVFRRLREPPAEFLRMLRAGLIDLADAARSEARTFARYLHVQNAARIEAATDVEGRIRDDTRELLLELFVSLSQIEPDRSIYPELSSYAVILARQAEHAVDRKDFLAAEDLYRQALATDPWWLDGLYNLASLELINWGQCGPDHTLADMRQAIDKGVRTEYLPSSAVNPHYQLVQYMERKLRELLEAAGRSGSGEIIGLCDKPGVSYIQPFKRLPPE